MSAECQGAQLIPPQKPKLTELAQKYTHPVGVGHKLIAHTGKSGLTPFGPRPPGARFATTNQKNYYDLLHSYQAWRGEGFTTRQLMDLEAFAPRYNNYESKNRPDTELSFWNPIHPLFSRDRWDDPQLDHLGKMYRSDGEGLWEPQNREVWKAMEPCLQLATLFLSNCHTFPWFDALLNDTYSWIQDGVPDEWKGSKLLKFDPRNPVVAFREHQKTADILKWAIGNIRYKLISGWTQPDNGLPDYDLDGNTVYSDGVTMKVVSLDDRVPAGLINVNMPFQDLMPILRKDVTSAERKQAIFWFTVTLLHETCHALWYHMRTIYYYECISAEPYFQDEPLAELGFSMEHSVFGGVSKNLLRHTVLEGKGLPHGTIFRSSFFNKANLSYNSSFNFKKNLIVEPPAIEPLPEDWDYNDIFPIPISYFEDLHHPEFWPHARTFRDSAHMGPITAGSRRRDGGMGRYTRIWDERLNNIEHIPIHKLMTQEELAAASLENLRRSRRARILAAVDAADEALEAAKQDSEDEDDEDEPMIISYRIPDPMKPPWQPFEDPEEGKDFDIKRFLAMENEKEQTEPTPPCPRYDEIKDYIFQNSPQGKLCFDTMTDYFPEPTLYKYIKKYGGLDITPQELTAFLKNCQDRGEVFQYWPDGNGFLKYRHPKSIPPSPDAIIPDQYPDLSDEDIKDFNYMCTECLRWQLYLQDYDFNYLLQLLQEFDLDLTAEQLAFWINWHDANHREGLLWCWGPNGVVRRREENWPEKTQLGDIENGNNAGSNIGSNTGGNAGNTTEGNTGSNTGNNTGNTTGGNSGNQTTEDEEDVVMGNT